MIGSQATTTFDPLFAGPGEVRALCRSMDWGMTPVGPVQRWPPSLRTAVSICLDARLPMAIWAVPGLTLIYNDSYAAVLGPSKHPSALGRNARNVLSEMCKQLGSEVERVIEKGESVAHPEQRLLIERDGGAAEESFFACSFTPIRADDGHVVGAVNVMVETTESFRTFRHRAALLETIIASSHDVIFAKDRDGRILLANPATLEIVGKPTDQVLGKIDLQFLADKEQARQVMANDRRVMETGQLIEAEEHVRSADGTARVWHAVKTPYRDASGRVIGLVGISRDITDRKRNDDILHAALESAEVERARLAAVLEALPAGIAIADASGDIIQTNAALAHIWGGPLGSESTCWDTRAWKGRWADTGKHLSSDDWALARALRTGEVVTSDRMEIAKLDGSGWATVMNVAAPIRNGDRRVVGAVVAVVDVTEQRRAEEAVAASEVALREAQRLARLGSWEWMVGGEALSWSEGLFLMLGRDASLGQPTLETLPHFYKPEGWSRLGPAIDRAVQTGAPYELELEMLRQDGTTCWTITRGEAVRGPTGTVVKLRGTSHDITERKLAEQERERFVAALRETDQRKNEFLGMLSHELRNPLTPMRNSLEILQRATPGGETDQRAKAIIDRQLSQLTRLVDDLLDVTRISRGKIRLQRARMDLVELVRQTVEDHRSLLDGHEVTLKLPGQAMWAMGDQTRLAQIIGNLLHNAAKFTPRGGKISVALERTNGRAVVEVADTGIGIEPEMLPRLFEPFAQAEHSLARTRGGLGLGLALVKGLIEQHGGTVKAYSEGTGRGSHFTLSLPLDEQATSTSNAPLSQKVGGRGLKVLVIEDNVDAADSLGALLDLEGYDVTVSYSGREGIAKARAHKPEVLLCDVGLPEMNGYEVARVFRNDPALRDVLLVALTGYAGPEDRHRAAEAGFQRHFPKPPDLPALEELLATTEAKSGHGARAQ